MNSKRNFILLAAAVTLSSCGGGGGSASSTPATSPGPAPGGLYVGYYQEDPANNPEDPTSGAFSLNLPTGDGTFSGNMFFTYLGCQSSNVGAVGGTKSVQNLSGTWSGNIDGAAHAGTYTGVYDTATPSYRGTYTHTGGKQFVDKSPCIQYFIAANGTWEMFPIDANVPASFSVSVSGNTISWSSVAGAGDTLVYLLDVATAQGVSGNPVVWQTLLPGSSTSISIPVSRVSGRDYVAVVGIADSSYQRKAFGSRRFTQP